MVTNERVFFESTTDVNIVPICHKIMLRIEKEKNIYFNKQPNKQTMPTNKNL